MHMPDRVSGRQWERPDVVEHTKEIALGGFWGKTTMTLGAWGYRRRTFVHTVTSSTHYDCLGVSGKETQLDLHAVMGIAYLHMGLSPHALFCGPRERASCIL